MTEKIKQMISKNEKILLDFCPSKRGFFSRLIELLFYSFPFLLIWIILARNNIKLVLFIIAIFLIIFAVITICSIVLRNKTNYVITNLQIVVERGICGTVVNNIYYKDIFAYKIAHSPCDFLFKNTAGTIKIYIKKAAKNEKIKLNRDVSIFGVKNFNDIVKILNDNKIKCLNK